MVEHKGWTPGDKASYLIAALNEPGTHMLHSIPTGATYEEVTAVVENRYGDHHLAEASHAQLRRRVQHAGESAEFPAAIDHLAHCAHVDSIDRTTHQ
jgi:hypothetical protein